MNNMSNTIPFIVSRATNNINSPYNITIPSSYYMRGEKIDIALPENIYKLFEYEPIYRKLYFEGKNVEFIGLSANMKRLLIFTKLKSSYDYKESLSLVDIDSGNTLYVFENKHNGFCSICGLRLKSYKGKDYLISNESEGTFVLDCNFEDHIHKDKIKPIRGAIFGDTFLFSYAKNKYHIFGLDGKKICESSYEPIVKTNRVDVQNLLENNILLTVSSKTSEDDILYSSDDFKHYFFCNVVNTIDDSIVLHDVRLLTANSLIKYGTFIYDTNYNKVSIEKTPQIIKTNISPATFITRLNELQDLKIYIESKSNKVCICEDVKVNTEDEILSIFDIDAGLFIVENGKLSQEVGDDKELHDLKSYRLNRLKIYFKNSYPNIYVKGKGFLFDPEDDGII